MIYNCGGKKGGAQQYEGTWKVGKKHGYGIEQYFNAVTKVESTYKGEF